MRLSRSIVGAEEAAAVQRVILEDGYLGMGTEVARFEEEVADFLGAPRDNVVVVASGTAALHLAVQAAVPPGSEVLVQSLTFVSSFQAISAAGSVPVACEVQAHNVLLDLNDAADRVTPDTRAVMPVHFASYPGDLDALYGFAAEHGLRVIEDAAHAFGCEYKGRKIGSFGDIVCFSFDGIKNITSGEGGAIVTADPDVLARVKDARLLGIHRDTERRFRGERSWDFDVTEQGYRYHMSNLMAAIGRVQLRRLPTEFAPSRVALARRYYERLGKAVEYLSMLESDLGPVVPHILPIRVLGGRRDRVRAGLEAYGVGTGLHYKPNHLLTRFGAGAVRLPVTERLFEEILSLPLHPELTLSEVDEVCEMVLRLCREGDQS